ncbi:MAG: hypothetical protein NVS2B7_22790 [Herpetosiphon sp.]
MGGYAGLSGQWIQAKRATCSDLTGGLSFGWDFASIERENAPIYSLESALRAAFSAVCDSGAAFNGSVQTKRAALP